MTKKALILFSGGLDSATVLAMALAQDYTCFALSFDYGQRSEIEIRMAKRLCDQLGVEHRVFNLDIAQFGGSALTDERIEIPTESEGIPITYVPARNTVFLSIALGWAEVLGVRDIFIGANVVDYSGYPDCRPEFLKQFEKLANLATKAGVEGDKFTIHAPLLHLSKAQIIAEGLALGVDYSMTCSCYDADEQGRACGKCESCRLRADGFKALNVVDPTLYMQF